MWKKELKGKCPLCDEDSDYERGEQDWVDDDLFIYCTCNKCGTKFTEQFKIFGTELTGVIK